MSNPNPKFVVDGHEFPNEESNLAGDGRHAPFYVFDSDAQDYVGGPYDTRELAQRAARKLVGGE